MEEEEGPFERQKLQWMFQKVSWQWSEAVGKQRGYALQLKGQAERLVKALTSSGRGDEVQSLTLSHRSLERAQASATVELLRLCSALKKLELWRASRHYYANGEEEAFEAMLKLEEIGEVVLVGAPRSLTLSR